MFCIVEPHAVCSQTKCGGTSENKTKYEQTKSWIFWLSLHPSSLTTKGMLREATICIPSLIFHCILGISVSPKKMFEDKVEAAHAPDCRVEQVRRRLIYDRRTGAFLLLLATPILSSKLHQVRKNTLHFAWYHCTQDINCTKWEHHAFLHCILCIVHCSATYHCMQKT